MAQPNMFGVTEFDQDPETAAELMRLRRQQQMADAMMGQSQKPLQGGMVGQVYVPPSITQGLAKLFQGYSAGQMARGVEDQYKKLASDRRAMEDAERGKIIETMVGRAEQPMGPPTPEGEMGVSAAVPAGTRDDVARAMMASKLPDYKKAGFQMYVTEGARKEDRAAAREDKLFQLQLAHQNNLEAIKQRAAEQRISQQQLREQIDAANERNARLVASLRQPKDEGAPIAVIGPDGNPMLVSRKDAIGKIPAGLGGKAQKEMDAKAAGAGDVDVALSTLRNAYDRLEKGGGITTTKDEGIANIPAAIRSSGPGQFVGRMMGTQNQSARNEIAMTRPALLAALMKATGMSAKQMDSNAELKLWISTATDPTLDVEANRTALDNIEKKYISGSGTSKQQASGLSPQEQAELDQLRARFKK